METTVTGSDHCEVELTEKEVIAFLLEELAARGLPSGVTIDATLSVLRKPGNGAAFRLSMRRSSAADRQANTAEAPATGTPALEPTPDAFSAGTEL